MFEVIDSVEFYLYFIYVIYFYLGLSLICKFSIERGYKEVSDN